MWRQLNKNLFDFGRMFNSDYEYSKEQIEQQNRITHRISQSIDRVIQADPGEEKTKARMASLVGLVREAFKIAIELFIHPNPCEFQWTPIDPSEKRLVIHPALTFRAIQEDGSLSDPRVWVGAEIQGKKPSVRCFRYDCPRKHTGPCW